MQHVMIAYYNDEYLSVVASLQPSHCARSQFGLMKKGLDKNNVSISSRTWNVKVFL